LNLLQIFAQIDELLEQHLEPAKAGLHTENSRTDPEKQSLKKTEPAKASPQTG
jgi:hypothetical protein